jgi:glycosyltransferase involved in cell wall biosynthesis
VRLAVDGKRLIQARTGPARWTEHMLERWSVTDVPFERIDCYTPGPTDNRWANPPKLNHKVVSTRFPIFVWENAHLAAAALSADLLFGASYTLPLVYPKRSVVSIQGIYEGKHAEPGPWWHKYRYSAMYKASAQRADMVLANSVSTKQDIVEYYGIDPDKIRIIYTGVGAPFGFREDREAVTREAAAVVGREGPYYLFVGKMSPRRHIPSLLRAFSEALPRLDPRMHLVLVGPNHLELPLDRYVAEVGLSDRVTHLPHLDQDRLAVAYSGAHGFFLPTTHEGLSATILEAIACGTPVVTVDHAPLQEGFIGHVWALESPAVELLKDAMLKLWEDPDYRVRLGQSGIVGARQFTWEKTADLTMQALWEVANR